MTFDLLNDLLFKKYVNGIKMIISLSYRIKKVFFSKTCAKRELVRWCIMIFIMLFF